ncbi:NAD-dependent epimerase/dehydratase family protein [Christiangramia sp. SM2212]|uniref:NAD-dependent epimerase/dehydratase family protein n=1 Tax=Christiangramia sediminicola TaxID=3073267 RepID=A0ABU1EQC4_9FLAO|nr:NAD-dependent epimerase/dehydratase family protein [Christiangramia sp. SM2212]MDR5590585.1 NAD-dependent epimerase/dehydratase family protein [Christiangramia sp. SM2212]
MKSILVTGAAGFIGYHLCSKLVDNGYKVIGLDNINDYYDTNLKYDRLKQLGIPKSKASQFNLLVESDNIPRFSFIRLNIQDRENLPILFSQQKFEKVINLAAQAGVRYSLQNPHAYIDSNIVGFANILELCKNNDIEHLIYASSSSVYGENKKIPFSVEDNVDQPISLYAATKKSNELMAYTYSHLFKFSVTGLRFFTVYGPWGRPDMAMHLFTDAIANKRTIDVYNNGNQERDFTYIDDIIYGMLKIIEDKNPKKESLYNIGNSSPVNLMSFIEEIEKNMGTKSDKNFLPKQPGDVSRTWADVESLKNDYSYKPSINLEKGVGKYIQWYKQYYL